MPRRLQKYAIAISVEIPLSPQALQSQTNPGLTPYPLTPQVPLKVNKVTSTKTQIPYEYYDIPFCLPPKKRGEMENLGEVLAGDAITNSPYQLEMKVPKACVKLCAKTYSEKDMKMFRQLIDEEYRVHWLLDSLPAAVR